MPDHKTEEAVQLFKEIVKTLISLIEHKHEFFKGHSERVAASCVRFSAHLGMPADFIDAIYLAGLLYDIGMVYPPIDVIHKQGKLTPEEMDEVKKHPGNAAQILSHLGGLKEIIPIIRHHHEAYDGSGYPDGLKATDIPIGARILSVVDTYDALTSTRPHRPALSPQEALDLIGKNAGKLFDPRVTEEFVRFMEEALNAGPVVDTVHKAVLETVEQYKKGQMSMFALPELYGKLQGHIKDPDATVEALLPELEPIESLHPVLVNLANSLQYGGGGKIRTLRQALMRIGVKDTAHIVMAWEFKMLYVSNIPVVCALLNKFWTHAVATAFLCRFLGEKTNYEDLDLLFVLGLTHDIGKEVLLNAVSEMIFQTVPPEYVSLDDIIANIQAIHVGFSAAQLKSWGMEDGTLRIIAQHELPEINSTIPRSLLILHAANMLTRKMGYSVFSDVPELSETLKLLGLDGNKLGEAIQDAINIIQLITNVSAKSC